MRQEKPTEWWEKKLTQTDERKEENKSDKENNVLQEGEKEKIQCFLNDIYIK